MTQIPSGFRLIEPMDEVMGGFAPVYLRQDPNQHVVLGFHVGPQHCNPRGHCHGGTWATMADILMGMNLGFVTGLSGPTVSLGIDFLGAAVVGQWVAGCAEILRSTPNLGFVQCRFTADGELALRANAVFRRKLPSFRDFNALLAPQPD